MDRAVAGGRVWYSSLRPCGGEGRSSWGHRMPGEAVASTPGAEVGELVEGDGCVVVPWQALVLGTWSLAHSGGTRVEACGLLVKPEKPTVGRFVGLGLKTFAEDEGGMGQVKEAWRTER